MKIIEMYLCVFVDVLSKKLVVESIYLKKNEFKYKVKGMQNIVRLTACLTLKGFLKNYLNRLVFRRKKCFS